MAYRLTTLQTVVADDSELTRKYYDGTCQVTQTLDKETVTKIVRVAAGAADAAVDLTPITQGYYYEIRSDYPVKYRVIGSGSAVAATQQTLIGQGATIVPSGAPLPDKCFAAGTQLVSSIYLEPISGAAQTANVTVIVTGDPVSAYTGG